jgi:predicted O-methyltransferase YrrM
MKRSLIGDPCRAATAKKHFKVAGVARLITVIEDAHQTITKLKDPLVLIDADKEGYVDHLNKLLPLVRPGGLILVLNTSRLRRGRRVQCRPRDRGRKR